MFAIRILKMRKQPKQQRSGVTVAAILEASVHILLRHGYRAATTRRIAEKAGVSIGSLYQFFATKDEIFAAALEAELIQLRPPAPPHPPTNLEEKLTAIIEMTTAELNVFRALMREAPHLIASSPLFAQKPLLRAGMQRDFQRHAKGLKPSERAVYSEMIYGLLDVLFASGWPPGDPAISRQQKCAALARMIANTIERR